MLFAAASLLVMTGMTDASPRQYRGTRYSAMTLTDWPARPRREIREKMRTIPSEVRGGKGREVS